VNVHLSFVVKGPWCPVKNYEKLQNLTYVPPELSLVSTFNNCHETKFRTVRYFRKKTIFRPIQRKVFAVPVEEFCVFLIASLLLLPLRIALLLPYV